MWNTTHSYYGALHFVGIGFMVCCVALGIYLGIKFKGDRYKRTRDKVLTGIGFLFVALEIFKIIFRIAVNEDADLRLISFQICSIPMYLLPFIAFMKEGKLKQAFIGYVSFQSFTSAFFYFVKPSAMVFTKYIAISMQSMFWHGIMVGSGVFAMIAYGLLCKDGFKTFLYSYILWVITAIIAVILDVVLTNAFPGTLLDLFYISPTSTFKYPLLGIIFKQPKPYPVYLVAFMIYYFLGGFMMYGIGCGITALVRKKKS